MNKTELKEIVLEQNKQKLKENLIEREVFVKVEAYIKNPFVIIISGIRRCGKSTLLGQIRTKYSGYYLNFDDDRLVNFSLNDFQILYETLIELYGEKEIFYFDEIQNISGWERFVRRLHDEGKKVFVTGSNASILSKELGTHLTGRHLNIALFPFSFKEYLDFIGFKLEKNSIYLTPVKANILKHFGEYLTNGGFPEYLKEKNKEYLTTLYQNIIYRDVISRYKVANEKTLKEMVYLVVTNLSKETSFNSLKKSLGLGSPTTVKEYFNYLENSFLVFLVTLFDYSLKKQIHSNKKVYVIDNGLAHYLGFRISSKGYGELLENIVFLELKKKKKEIYYYKDNKECDFILREGAIISEAIQVCFELNKEDEPREINGLLDTMKKFRLREGLILTYDQEEERKVNKKTVKIVPVWKWLLEGMYGEQKSL